MPRISIACKKLIAIFKESLRGCVADKLYLHASSLTFYTLLSVVPLLAVAFGFAKGFGFENALEEELYKRFSEQREIVNYAVEFARSLLEQVEGSYIAGVGVLFLFLFVISLFWTIEGSMNAIWKVTRPRPILRMLTDYLAMMVICPVLFVLASSLTVFVMTQIHVAVEQHDVLQGSISYFNLLYRGITLLLIWVLFSSIYLIMPHKKVRPKYAVLAAVFAGSLYYIVQTAVLSFQIGVSQYSAIYGSFAALPLFLFWLQISWMLVLLGAEIAYHSEHLSPVFFSSTPSIAVPKKLLALLLSDKIVQNFVKGEKPWTLKGLSKEFGVSEMEVTNCLESLIKEGIISSAKSDENILCYQPAQDVQRVTVHSVLRASNPYHLQSVLITHSKHVDTVIQKVRQYENEVEVSSANIPIHQL